jgi:hypothetical protein
VPKEIVISISANLVLRVALRDSYGLPVIADADDDAAAATVHHSDYGSRNAPLQIQRRFRSRTQLVAGGSLELKPIYLLAVREFQQALDPSPRVAQHRINKLVGSHASSWHSQNPSTLLKGRKSSTNF